MTLVSYAQNCEDVLLHRALRSVSKGFYIDVGAGDPELSSVTKAFYDMGWSGINIEPVPLRYNRLVADRLHDINLAIVIADADEIVPFFAVEGYDELSTMMVEQASAYQEDGREILESMMQSRTLASVCEEFVRGEIHFLKIDVEGAELAVLAGADFERFRPWILVVESYWAGEDAPDAKAWEELLLAADYLPVYFDGLNRFFVSAERAEELTPAFDYPVGIRDNFVRSGARVDLALSRIADMLDSTSGSDEHEILERLERLQEDRIRFESDADAANEVISTMKVASARVDDALTRIADVVGSTSGWDEHEILERLGRLREDRIRFEQLAESSFADVRALRVEVESLRATNVGQAVELDAFWQQSFERERYISWQANEIARRDEGLKELTVRLTHIEPRLSELEQQLAEANSALVAENLRLATTLVQAADLIASTSWRATLPLRVLRRPGHYVREFRARR
jgi:FkbM family methyltransferase